MPSQYDKKTKVLFTKIGISPYKAGQRIENSPQYKGIAVWDTGATGTVITPKVAAAQKLNPMGKKEVHGNILLIFCQLLEQLLEQWLSFGRLS